MNLIDQMVFLLAASCTVLHAGVPSSKFGDQHDWEEGNEA